VKWNLLADSREGGSGMNSMPISTVLYTMYLVASPDLIRPYFADFQESGDKGQPTEILKTLLVLMIFE